MATERAAAIRRLQAEIDSAGLMPPGYGRDSALLALAGRVRDAVSGFERVRLLEALCGMSAHVRLFAEAWTAHFQMGERDLRDAAMFHDAPDGGVHLAIPPRDALALLAAGRMMVRHGRFDDALLLFRRAVALRPGDPFAATWEATTLASLGRHDEADGCFDRIGRRHPWPCAITRLSAAFWRGLSVGVEAIDRASTSEIPTIEPIGSPAPVGADVCEVTLISCDRVYFLRYGEAYVRGWAAWRPGQARNAASLLHVHLVDPDPSCHARVEEWQARGLPISASAEPLPGNPETFCIQGSPFEARTYHACARLRVLPGILARYRAPVLMTDMDLVPCSAPEAIWRSVGDADAGLIRLSARAQPLWQEFYLALAAFRPTASGRRFAAMLAAYVDHFLARKQWIWSLDQTALYSAVLEAGRNLSGWRHAALPSGLIDSADLPSSNAVFRHHVASQGDRSGDSG